MIGQSQPRTSRHLRLLVDAEILERTPEGAFVFYRLAEHGSNASVALHLASLVSPEDPVVAADLAEFERVRRSRSLAAAEYLQAHADELATVRGLHVADEEVERVVLELIGDEGPIGRLLDIGTGTGRMLESSRRTASGASASTSTTTCSRSLARRSATRTSRARRSARVTFAVRRSWRRASTSR